MESGAEQQRIEFGRLHDFPQVADRISPQIVVRFSKLNHDPESGQMTNLTFNFESFPVLYTERLILREITASDAEAIFRVRGDIRVTRLNSGKPMESITEARDLIDKSRRAFLDQRRIDWGIVLKSAPQLGLIGRVGFNYWLKQDRRASIGYDLAYIYWGNGIMTEAVRAILKFGFEQMNLNRVEADAAAENVGSIRVLEKTGFQREGLQQEQYFEWDEFHDLVLFAVLRKEYEQQNIP
jgi:RimJ/RimL family protein N-acetyltransferase